LFFLIASSLGVLEWYIWLIIALVVLIVIAAIVYVAYRQGWIGNRSNLKIFVDTQSLDQYTEPKANYNRYKTLKGDDNDMF